MKEPKPYKDILLKAVRQFRHNDSEQFVVGLDYDEVLKILIGMQPTCTATERAFIDEIKEKGVLFRYCRNGKETTNAIGLGTSIIDQTDFNTDLKELVNAD